MWRWFETEQSGWSRFYSILEGIAKTAKKQLNLDSIMSALSAEKGEKTKCTSCNKYHSRKCNKIKTTAVLSQEGDKICPVCDKLMHTHKTKSGNEGFSKQVKDCPEFK